MFGPTRGVTLGFAGWLWADLLLGLFVIFALASTVGPRGVPARPEGGAGALPSGAAASAVASTVTGAGAASSGASGLAGARATTTTGAGSRGPGVDPAPLDLVLAIDGASLLGADARGLAAEQARIAVEAAKSVGGRRVALVMAYGSHADARTGDRLAELATAQLHGGAFEGAAVKAFHNIVPGDRGSRLQLSVYFFQD